MKTIIALTTVGLLSMTESSPAPAQSPPPSQAALNSATAMPTTSPTDAGFVRALAQGGLAEVMVAKDASRRASQQEVKDFAKQMVEDHSKANDQLKALADSRKIPMPTTVDVEHQNDQHKLDQLNGAEFDHQYIDGQVNDHQQTVQLLQQEIDSGQDAALRAFAKDTLTVVSGHLAMARQIQQQMAHQVATR
jgi:putative membrane protein